MAIIRKMLPSDSEAVLAIYGQGIETGNATFQTQIPLWQDWDNSHLNDLRFVAVEGGEVAGWAALTAVSSRCVYAGVAEVSVYIATGYRGKGLGFELLNHLVAQSETKGFWTLQAGIFPENASSLLLHAKCGFREVGYREKIGKIKGIWRNTILLERRSQIAGLD